MTINKSISSTDGQIKKSFPTSSDKASKEPLIISFDMSDAPYQYFLPLLSS